MTPDETFAALPPALLLLGPGSWGAAVTMYETHRSSFSTKVEKLDAESARHVRAQAYIRPFGRAVKVILVGLDGASAAAQDILLKVLEEPPSYCPVHPGRLAAAAGHRGVPVPGAGAGPGSGAWRRPRDG